MPRLIEGAWAGDPVYIIGGGPSLKGFDWSLLKGRRRIIAINMALLDCPWADLWFSEDERVVTMRYFGVDGQREGWDKAFRDFKGVKLFHSLAPSQAKAVLSKDPSIRVIERKVQSKFWSRTFAEGLSYSSNSMIGALNVADILGCNPIYILGLDCNAGKGRTVNFHDRYPSHWKTGDDQYIAFKSDLENWAALHLRHRRVVNLNPESGVDCWPKEDRDFHFKHSEPFGAKLVQFTHLADGP